MLSHMHELAPWLQGKLAIVKLGFICVPSNNAYYRVITPMLALERLGHTVVWPEKLGEDVPLRTLAACDLVHCYRSVDRMEDLRRLAAYGVALTFDNDDNYAVAEMSEAGSGLAGNRFNQKVSREMLKMALDADLMTTPSPMLADVYRRAGVESVAVIGNHLDRSMFGFGSSSPHDGIVVGWVAGREHRSDLDRLPIVAALERLLNVHGNVRVLTVGLRLPIASARYEYIADVPYPQLLKVIGRIDLGIAPLADIPFNHFRSDVKLKEYASGAAAWAASPVGPYQGLGDQEGGVLVGNDEWFDVLDDLVRSTRRRRQLAKQALKWAKRQALDRHVEDWERAFSTAAACAQAAT
jgi:hypothetical protein